MASIEVRSYDTTSATIRISGLSSGWNTKNYESAGITEYRFTGSGVSSIRGIIAEESPTSSTSTRTYVNIDVEGLEPDTEYTFYGFTQAANGLYYSVGSVTFTTDPEEELLEPYISDYTVYGTSIILEFDDLDDCPYIQVMYRINGSSNTMYEPSSGYTELTSRNNTITLTDLELGQSYVISFRYSADGDTREGTVSYGTIDTGTINDDILVSGIYGLWHAYYEYTGYGWSKSSLTFELKFSGGYPFHSSYFVEAGVCNVEPKLSSTSKPSGILDYVSAESVGYISIEIDVTGLSAGSLLSAYLYVKTINGTYIQIPFGNMIGVYGKKVATKPNSLSYSSGHVPTQGEEVNLLASDIQKFIRATDCVSRWMFDETASGIDESYVEQGEPIYASTYIDFYDFLERVSDEKPFNNVFSISNIGTGKPIVADDLNDLRTALNNMISAV